MVSSTTVIVNQGDRTVIIGNDVISFHPKMKGIRVTVINKKCYIDGYEWIDGEWKKTFWGTWHKYF